MKNLVDNLAGLSVYRYPKRDETVNIFSLDDKVNVEEIKMKSYEKKTHVRCIGIIPSKKSTNAIEAQLNVVDNYIVPCIDRDILPIVIIGKDKEINIGKAFVKGFKMKKGAIAESVSNESNNIIAVGRDYSDIALAINHIIKIQGGIAVAKDGKIIGDISVIDNNIKKYDVCEYELIDKLINLTKIVEKELECGVESPFMHLSFLTLENVPKWKITSRGLKDVENQEFITSIIEE